MEDRIKEALASSGADYTEIRLEERQSTRVRFRGRELEAANANLDSGGMVRCLVRDRGWGVSTFNDASDLRERVRQACECARLSKVEEPVELAPASPVVAKLGPSMGRDFREVGLAEKKALAEYYNGILLSRDRRIVDTSSAYLDSFSRRTLATSEGTWIEEERPSVTVSLGATAREGDNVQMAHDSVALPAGWEVTQGREELAREVASRAVELLGAKSVKAGRYTVVVDPSLAGVFIHEAFGHLSEADFVYENPKAREMMRLGRRFGREILNVFDDGSVPGRIGTLSYDDEGTPARRNWLIREGELVGRLHSRQTAAKMGEAPTGNARALDYRFAPIVRMTNTAIDKGTTPLSELIGDVELGVYACDAYGGMTQLETFSFSSARAWMIRDGKLAEPVRDVILAGNLFTTLANIDAIGDDFRWSDKGGGCGKSGQSPLPVGMGAPHIRIRDVVIGGE